MNKIGPALFAGKHLAVFGAGYVGGEVVRQALAAGLRVTCLTRNEETAANLRQAGAEVVCAELESDEWHASISRNADLVLNTVSAGGRGADGYYNSYVRGNESLLRWGGEGHLIYTSSTSVYPQEGGVLVDENAETGPHEGPTGCLLKGERLALAWPGRVGTVLRLAGIYGPGRTVIMEAVRRGELSGFAETHLNLIHRDDICAAVWHVWSKSGDAPGIFNLSDDGRATRGEIADWLAQKLGVSSVRFTGEAAAGRRRITPDRTIDNGRIKALTGWLPGYPSFREGYSAILGA